MCFHIHYTKCQKSTSFRELKLTFECDQPQNIPRGTEKLQTRCAKKPDAAFGIIFFQALALAIKKKKKKA